jgi:hypothetical protein
VKKDSRKEMKNKSKVCIILTVLSLIGTEVYAQGDVDSSSHTSIYLFAGLGYKYHLTQITPYPYSFEQAYTNHLAFNLGVMADAWGGGKHFIGIEVLGFPYKYGDDSMKPKDFTVISNAVYRRKIQIADGISVCPAAGFTIFSNDPVHIGTVYLDIGGSYNLESYELFIKNSFRFAMPFMLDNAPSLVTAGCAIII